MRTDAMLLAIVGCRSSISVTAVPSRCRSSGHVVTFNGEIYNFGELRAA